LLKLVYSIGLIVSGLAIGKGLHVLGIKGSIKHPFYIERVLKIIQKTAILIFNPFLCMGVFWIVRISNPKLLLMPALCIIQIMTGGALGLMSSKALRHDRKQAGAMFAVGALSNVGSFGCLISFIFYGEMSYAYSSIYAAFNDFICFSVIYPISKSFGGNKSRFNILKALWDPYIMTMLLGIVIGCIFNMSGLKRPEVFKEINTVLIPLTSTLLIITVGYNIEFRAVNRLLKECLAISGIKYLALPVVMTALAYALGLDKIDNGLVLSVILILSAMPPAFNSIIISTIYGLDTDIANSGWLFSTVLLVIMLPVIYFLNIGY
jgi:predicted permease